MDEATAGIMITNPNTLGLFEENIREIARIVHERGGLVYCDGANMNAVMGVVKPGAIGVDILHLNLHKTFSTPHGGGGPGAGPARRPQGPGAVSPRSPGRRGGRDLPASRGLPRLHRPAAGLPRPFRHPRPGLRLHPSLGAEGLARASQLAVLNANYLKERLKGTLHLAYDRPCMHECVFSDRDQHAAGIATLDMAKRLMDYGYHPPTIYFPLVVPGAIMIEPTETETKEDLDRFVEAMQTIVREARENPDSSSRRPPAASAAGSTRRRPPGSPACRDRGSA